MTEPAFLVSGLINLETTCAIDDFPLPYVSQRFAGHGIDTHISGVGFNVAKALTTLGNNVDFHAMIGADQAGLLARSALRSAGIDDSHVMASLPATPHSVILFDRTGRRASTTDLKTIQQTRYDDNLRVGLSACDWAVLCNLEANRDALAVAAELGKPVATDVHGLADIDDAYNADFMAAATVLFCSHEHIPLAPADWADALRRRYAPEVIVIGLGADGALLSDASGTLHVAAQATRLVVNTIGAGDALFSSFLHTYARTGNAAEALRRACWFASWKIGVASAADGFLTADEWATLHG